MKCIKTGAPLTNAVHLNQLIRDLCFASIYMPHYSLTPPSSQEFRNLEIVTKRERKPIWVYSRIVLQNSQSHKSLSFSNIVIPIGEIIGNLFRFPAVARLHKALSKAIWFLHRVR